MPPSQTPKKYKYPVQACRDFMRNVSNAGFGTLVNDGATSQRSLAFRKRSFESMGAKQQDAMKIMKINTELYDSFLMESDDSLQDDSQRLLLSTPSDEESQD